ncbi:MAG TPA: M3 family metallopeptidase, partial [Longimicrobiales bacterium]
AMEERLERVVGVVRHLLAVRDSEELRAAYDEVNPEITEFYASLPMDPSLWRAVREYASTGEARSLAGVRRRHVEKTVRSFVRAGADLPAGRKAEVVQLQIDLAEATKRFAENVLDSTNAYELVLTDPDRLAGLPESIVALARASAQERGVAGWRFTLHAPSYTPFMENAHDRELRRELWSAYSARATEPERDNRPLVGEILRLRRRLAQALGYRDWAQYQLEERMAGTGERALAFAQDLTERTRPHFRADVAALEEEAASLGYERLEPWDVAYTMERIRRRRFELDPEELRPYFPLDAVLRGVFEVAGRVFGVWVEEVKTEAVWHPDVRLFDVHDEQGVHIGSFYADLFPRADKRAGAWMNDLITGGPRAGGFDPHLALVAGNLTPPAAGKPSLLTKDEVETLFHEFGHTLHHLLSRVEVPGRAGTRVAWDFVELPSQLMENWTWDREALRLFARHYQTGEPLPDQLYQRMARARTYMAAYDQMRQLSFATVDLELHINFDPEAADADAMCFAEAILRPFAIRPDAVNRDMLASFSHVFSGAYAAGYYSYKWAEVLDADAFTRFEAEGVFNRETGRAYVDAILARGDAADPMVLFRDFMGRDPDPGALLRRTLPSHSGSGEPA